MFYPKLAFTNLKKNGKTYVPYLITSIVSVMMFYVMIAITGTRGLNQLPGASNLSLILLWTASITGIFAAIFLFYTNGFLVRQRKKEFGLYQVLGMDKRNLAKMMVWETLITSLCSLIAGIAMGELLGRLMFLILLKMLHIPTVLKYKTTAFALGFTLILFLAVFAVTLLFNLIKVQASNPIGLLTGGHFGEREPKVKWLLAILGILTLGTGYFIAQTVKSPMMAIGEFFIAVILVIAGTYFLFTAGSIAILKMLKKNKRFYYQSRHFISVSGMIYRMRQNAVGLANICIMSTVVLVLVSVTICLYAGMGDVLKTRFPTQVTISVLNDSKAGSENEKQTLAMENQIVQEEAKAHDVQIKNRSAYKSGTYGAIGEEKTKNLVLLNAADRPESSNLVWVRVLPLSDYDHLTGSKEVLDSDQVLMYRSGTPSFDTMKIDDSVFKIKEGGKPDHALKSLMDSDTGMEVSVIVMPDEAVNTQLIQAGPLSYSDHFDLGGSKENKEAAVTAMQKKMTQEVTGSQLQYREWDKKVSYSLFGSFLFLGVFVGALFLMATVLIIYYKQISEGYEDRSRYQIMQKVGMSKKEVRASIKSQILMVFFIPLMAAVIHVAFAFKVIKKLLSMFYMTNVHLFIFCTIGTILCFALFYALVFMITSREYYKIVK